ncbi:hypothetical protein ABPG77_005372 [Micractinium sp. CCAP 211/92]
MATSLHTLAPQDPSSRPLAGSALLAAMQRGGDGAGPFGLQPGNPLLQVLQLAQLAASLPSAQAAQAPLAPASASAPAPAPASTAAQAAYYASALGAMTAPTSTPSAPPATSGTSSERLGRPGGDATVELEAAAAGPNSIAGLKLPVTCNDIRGVVYLDQQVVACYCPSCEHRVAGGHGRPLFSFTRFERHSGSKAKKWRLSIRIDPGAVKEAPIDEPPLALGQWLESKGLVSWAPRGGLKIGPSGGGIAGAGSSDDEGSPLYGEDSGSVRRHFTHGAPSADRRQPTVGPRPPSHGGAPTANGVLGKRARVEYDTPDLPSHADRKQWLESQQAVFDAVVAADEAEPPRGGAAPEPPAAPAQGGGEAAAPAEGGAAAPQQPAAAGEAGRDEGGDAASRAQRRRSAAQHAAIFGLVYGLLEEGDDRRSFNEVYLPWLNDLSRQRLEAEFTTLRSYLGLLRGGMAHETVRGLMAAYVRAVIVRASSGAAR